MFKQKPKTPTFFKRASLLAILAVVTMASFVAAFSRDEKALAATSSTINFQARLLTAAGNIVPDGQYNVEFKLYDAASGGTSVWTETRTTSDKVRVVNGYLTVNLGSVTAFGSINWDQELWLTMNIGGTGAASWDGEMTPRLKLTAVPYAFTAGKLVGGSGSNTTTLDAGTPSGNNTIHLPAESGTLCIQASANCGFALSSGGTNYIQNQFSAAQTTANFWISGTGRMDTALQSPAIRPTANGVTAIQFQNVAGTSTAMSIDTTNNRVSIGNGGTAFAPQEALDVIGNIQVRDAATATKGYRLRTTGGSLDFEASGADLYLSNWSGANYTGTQRNYLRLESGANVAHAVGSWQFATSPSGTTRHTIDGTTSANVSFNQDGEATDFSVQGDTDANLFFIQGSSDRVGIGTATPGYKLDVAGDINILTGSSYRINGTAVCTAAGCTPAAGSTNYIQNGTSLQTANYYIQSAAANSVAAIIRGAAAQTSSLLQLLDGSTGYTIAQFSNNGYLTLGSDSIAKAGQITLNDGTASNTFSTTIVVPTALTASRTITLPDETGTICIQSSTTCGFAPTTGSASYIQNQNAGQQASSNFWISGTGRADTALQSPLFDTPTAVALNIGTTNATGINLNKDTTITGALTQSGGILDLTGNGASTIKTSSGALSIRANGTNILTLNTSGAGTVNVGVDNTTTINLGGGSDVARTINVGNPASGTANQTVNIGTQHGTSVTTIQGGSSGTAIAITPASGGSVGITTAGAGNIALSSGAAGSFTTSGALTMTAGAASTWSTSSGALTLTSAAAATWSTSAGSLTVQAAGANSLNLNTGGAGTVALGDTNSTTINIGRGSDIARNISIGNAGSTTAQTVTIGSTGSTSTTTIQGGTGAGAI
ncbi:MAG TPA: hypothetical protein VLA92_02790, partial [Candidatus Saccharimonadales bacterium]|nr:hypothetical protein [Candidatus Saccharimonadales bacterium]